MATKREIIKGVLKASQPTRKHRANVPAPIFGGPKDGRPNVTVRKHKAGKRGPIFGGPKDGRPVAR